MLVGTPKEIKDHEYRVAVTPDGAAARIGFSDEAYRAE